MIALAVLAAALVLWLVSALGTCISYGGFKARRRGSRIEVERGLLQHVFQGVDVERVQSVTIEQTLIRRLMGYCRIVVGKIDAASDGDEAAQSPVSQGVVVHPFVKMSGFPRYSRGSFPNTPTFPARRFPSRPSRFDARCFAVASGWAPGSTSRSARRRARSAWRSQARRRLRARSASFPPTSRRCVLPPTSFSPSCTPLR